MLTNHVIWQSPLRWNEFRRIYENYLLFIRFNLSVETKKLSIFRLTHQRLSGLELMDTLSNEGYSSKEISEYLNSQNIKIPKGLEYYPKLLWVSLFKRRRRQRRYQTDDLARLAETVVVVLFRSNL